MAAARWPGAGWLPSRSPRGLPASLGTVRAGARVGISRRCTCPVETLARRCCLAAVYTDPTQWRRWPSLDELRIGSPMAEPRAAPAAEVVVSGHDALLATKLHLPRPRPGFIPRAWLSGWMRGWRVGWCWCAPRRDTAKRWCWPTGPGAAGGRWPGCRWMQVI